MSENGNGEQAAAALKEAAVALPEVWDRTRGDAVSEFAGQLHDRWRIAKAIAQSGLTSQKRPEAVLTIMLAAYEIGLPVMQALRGMYYVDGKLGIEGHLMDALAIARCGVTKTIKRREWDGCELVLHREGWTDVEVSFTLEDAKRGGLIADYDPDTGEIKPSRTSSGKALQTWVKWPKRMCYWRALSDGLKIIAPDFFGGIYELDELREVAEAHVVAHTPSVGAELDELDQQPEAEPADDSVEPDLFG